MWLKYTITNNQWTVAVKMNPAQNKVVLGGLAKHLDVLDTLRKDYFKVRHIYTTSYPNHNKIKYKFNCVWDKFCEVVEKIKKDDLIVQKVETHGRLIR